MEFGHRSRTVQFFAFPLLKPQDKFPQSSPSVLKGLLWGLTLRSCIKWGWGSNRCYLFILFNTQVCCSPGLGLWQLLSVTTWTENWQLLPGTI